VKTTKRAPKFGFEVWKASRGQKRETLPDLEGRHRMKIETRSRLPKRQSAGSKLRHIQRGEVWTHSDPPRGVTGGGEISPTNSGRKPIAENSRRQHAPFFKKSMQERVPTAQQRTFSKGDT